MNFSIKSDYIRQDITDIMSMTDSKYCLNYHEHSYSFSKQLARSAMSKHIYILCFFSFLPSMLGLGTSTRTNLKAAIYISAIYTIGCFTGEYLLVPNNSLNKTGFPRSIELH